MSGRLLVQMHGTPGSGKSALAQALGEVLHAVVIDKDILSSGAIEAGVPFERSGRVAYEQAWLLIPSLLHQGFDVVHDSPCFWPIIEERGRAIASSAGARYAMIEVQCSDEERGRRLASRAALPSQPRELNAGSGRAGMYEPSCDRLVLDGESPLSALRARAVAYLRETGATG